MKSRKILFYSFLRNDLQIVCIFRFMFELLSKANIGFGNKTVIIDTLDKIIGYVNQDGQFKL